MKFHAVLAAAVAMVTSTATLARAEDAPLMGGLAPLVTGDLSPAMAPVMAEPAVEDRDPTKAPLELSLTPKAPAAREPVVETIDFGKGTQDFLLYGRYESTALATQRNLYTVSASYGYYFLDRLSINPTMNFHYAAYSGEDIVGTDFSLALRYHFWTHERWTAFIEAGVGACYFDHRYPIGASHFEFTAGGGVGLGYEIMDHTWLTGEIRLDHYSNASIWGSDRHQSYNNLGGFVGVMWTF